MKVGDRVAFAVGIGESHVTIVEEVCTGYGADPLFAVQVDNFGRRERLELSPSDLRVVEESEMPAVSHAPIWTR